MILCDTSIWIEYFRGKSPYYDVVSSLLERGEALGLECVFGELLQGVIGKQERKLILECWDSLPKYREKGLWLEAGEYGAIHGFSGKGIGLIDAAIAIATLKSPAQLWTLDKKLNSTLPGRYRFVFR